MCGTVAMAALAERIEELGPVAYLITVAPEEGPHVVSVWAAWDGDRLVVRAGRTSSTNVERRPSVALLWAAPPGRGYSLIVDGTALSTGHGTEAVLAIEPTAAVLHRTPDGDPSQPSCIRLLP